jgi:DNA primase small subunit
MLELVKRETLKLLGFLTADFGFSENVIHVAFSGGRGYHIHIRDPRIFTLGGDERREIVDYLTGRGLDLESFIAKHKIIGGHGIEVVSALRCPPENAPGWGGRLNHAFISFQEELCEMPEDQALKMLCSTKGMKYNKANEFYTYIKTFDQILHGDIDEETAIQKLSSIKWIKDAEDFYLRLRLSYMVRKGEFDKIKSLKYSREFDIHKYKRICEDLSTGTINEPEAIKRLSSVGIFPIKTIAEQIREGNLDGFKGISGNWNILEKYLGEEGISIGSESYFDRERGETDEPVTADVRRLIRCPGSLHGGSGLRVTPLSIRDLEDFDPLQDAVVFGDESIPLEILKPFDTQMLGQSYHLVEGPTELPACVAVFLMARGVAEARTKL